MRWRRPHPTPVPKQPATTRIRRTESVAFFLPVTPRCEITAHPVPGGVVVTVASVEPTTAGANFGLRNVLHVLVHYTQKALAELAEAS